MGRLLQESVAASNPFTASFHLKLASIPDSAMASKDGHQQEHLTTALAAFDNLQLHCQIPDALLIAFSEVGIRIDGNTRQIPHQLESSNI